MPVPVEALVNLPLCNGLTTVELEEFASQLRIAEIEARGLIIKEADEERHPIYILLAGTVEVVKHGVDNRDHVIASLSAPSVFGEVEVLANRAAIASVYAHSDVELACLNRGVFDELCEANRPCMLKVVKNLAATLALRLAATDGRLAAYFNVSSPISQEALGKMHNVLYSTWHKD